MVLKEIDRLEELAKEQIRIEAEEARKKVKSIIKKDKMDCIKNIKELNTIAQELSKELQKRKENDNYLENDINRLQKRMTYLKTDWENIFCSQPSSLSLIEAKLNDHSCV